MFGKIAMCGKFRLWASALGGMLVFSSLASPASAGPMTYQGVLGKFDIIAEFTDDPTLEGASLAGRYSYMHQGIDIPLHLVDLSSRGLELVEEKPCDRVACPDDTPAPLGAMWRLEASDDGLTLNGNWQGKVLLPIVLLRVAERDREPGEEMTARGLQAIAERLAWSDVIIDGQTNPYDYLKLNIGLETKATTEWDNAAFAMVADPRIGMAYPRIASLGGNVSPDRANEVLNQRHWHYGLSAFSCAALRYSGFHDWPNDWTGEVGTMGGFDWMGANVTQLTPKVMSWIESGSVWCGGGSPSHFSRPLTMDVERGELLSMVDIFLDWAAEGPGEPIIELVNARREITDIEWENECGLDDLIETNLAAYFRRGENGEPLVTFGIYGLSTVNFACADDLVTLPLFEVGPHLTPEFAELVFD